MIGHDIEDFAPGPLDLSAVRELATCEFDAAYDALLLELIGMPPAERSMIIEVELSPKLLRFAQELLP